MIVVLKNGVSKARQDQLIEWFKSMDLGVHVSVGESSTVLGLIGDTAKVDLELVESLDIVDSAKRVSERFKRCNRKFHPEDTIVEAGGDRKSVV